ncbi:MAG: Tim44 domain-containing protein [Burkholderiaceae bacterium]
MKLWSWILVLALAAAHANADAARLGGGRSAGKQSSNVTQRYAAPQSPGQAAPAKPAAAPNAAPNTAPTPAAAPKRPWGAMLGGLAAGLGLAWLAHSLGLGAEMGQFLLIALLVLVAFAVLRMFMRPRPAGNPSRWALQGAGSPADAQAPAQYNPAKVGNDASARPWERSGTAFEAANVPQAAQTSDLVIGSALAGSQNWGIPEGFDVAGFLAAAKRNFTTLQAAWDRADIATLRSMMTDEMLAEIRAQLAEREAHRNSQSSQPNQTDVLMLEAQLLGIEDLGDGYMASVEFSGMIREEPSAGPSPFREVWNMTKPKSGASGWLVAGVQALQ